MNLPRSSPSGYAAAALAVAAATAVRLALSAPLGRRQPLIVFFLAVLFAAWRCGLGPSILAVVLSIAVATWLFLPATAPGGGLDLADLLSLANFVAVSAAIIAYSQSNRAARRRLEAEVAERARANETVAEHARLAEYGRELGSTLARSTDLRDMLDRCVRSTVRHLDGAFARIWTVDDSGETLELQASAGLYTHTDGPHGRIGVGEFKIGQIARDRRPHLTNAVIGDPLVPEQAWAIREGLVGFAGYPLDVEGRLVGVLAVFARHELSRAEVDMMASVADEIAVGIERKRAEERLHRQGELLRVTLASIGDGVIATDPAGRVAVLNVVAAGLTGWSQGDAAGRSLDEVFRIVNEDTRQPVENPALRALREGAIAGLANHTILIARDGTERAIDDSAAPIRDEQGQLGGAVLVFRDVTAPRGEQRSREASEERFRALVAASSQIVWTTDPDGSITEDSPSWRAFTGQSYDEWAGWGWLDAIHPEDRERAARAWSAAVATRSAYQVEYRLRRADGSHRWTAVRGVPVLAPDGSVREWVGMNTDVNDRREAEDAARESHLRVADILGSMTDACTGFDREWRHTYVNRRWEAMFGKTADQAIGRTIWDLFPEVVGSPIEEHYRRAARDGVGVSFEVVSPYSNRWIMIRAYPTAQGLASYIQDVDDRRRANEELEAAKAEAERANEAKSQFLAVLSHELRTPLNPILLAASSMLDRPADPAELRPTLEMIRQNVNLQARLIDDLLDVMRIVRGKMPLHWEVADCHRLIQQAIQICRSEVFGKVLRLDLDLAAEAHHVNADPARLQQVFWNLIKNAVKFTPEGGSIAIRTRNDDGPDGGEPRISIEVADSGIGIDPEILPKIFDPFQQGETTITRKFGGLGLGLAICKGIVEAHGGTLAVASEGRGTGTSFRVSMKALPRSASAVEAEPDGAAIEPGLPYPAALTILVVEDEPATLRLMARLLRGLGHAVTTASTISRGFEEFQAGAFDLVISDIGLPDGSGLDLIRRAVAFRGPIPAIALTGYGMEEDIRRSRAAGFTAHLTKPIDFTKLEAMIQQVAPVRL